MDYKDEISKFENKSFDLLFYFIIFLFLVSLIYIADLQNKTLYCHLKRAEMNKSTIYCKTNKKSNVYVAVYTYSIEGKYIKISDDEYINYKKCRLFLEDE